MIRIISVVLFMAITSVSVGCSDTAMGTDGFSDAEEGQRGPNLLQQDSDGDGLSDSEERQLGTNPLQQDSDGDGLSDLEERRLGTNPLQQDSDFDGLSDIEERRLGTNPLQWDSDGDGLSDSEERQLGTNPLQRDSDGDSLSDSEERQLGTNPLHGDTDADGLDDGAEIRANTNPLFPDTDRDGFVDGDDVLPLADAKVRVSVVSFLDKSERGIFHGDTNARFTIFVGAKDPVMTPVYQDVQNENVASVTVDVPDNMPTVRVGILAQEHAPVAAFLEGQAISAVIMAVTGLPIPINSKGYGPYDISDRTGTDLDSMVLLVDLDANTSVRATGDGSADGDIGRLEASVAVEIAHGAY